MSETIDLLRHPETALRRGTEVLRRGGVVAFPTETVYGLGVLAGDPERTARLRALKGRSETKPFQQLIADPADAARCVRALPLTARRLAERFWPGPLTLVLPVGDGADGGADEGADEGAEATIGLRCPGLPFVRGLIREAGSPIVATSANPAGDPPARDAATVARMFAAGIDLLLDGGQAALGEPSTVVAVTGERIRVLRAGAIPAEALFGTAAATHAPPGRTTT